MKFRVTMKDPDTLDDAITEASKRDLPAGLSDHEKELVAEARQDETRELCQSWFEFSEYLTVEVDTVAKTCVVIER